MSSRAMLLAIIGFGLLSSHSLAGSLPPELVAIFEQIGLELDENGNPVSPQPPAAPAPPVEPITPEELFAQLGIPLPEAPLEPTVPPVQQPPVDPPAAPTPEELSELLGLPIEIFLPREAETETLSESIFPAPDTSISPQNPPQDPLSLEDLAEQLGLPSDVFLGADATSSATNNTASLPEPATLLTAAFVLASFAATTRRR